MNILQTLFYSTLSMLHAFQAVVNHGIYINDNIMSKIIQCKLLILIALQCITYSEKQYFK